MNRDHFSVLLVAFLTCHLHIIQAVMPPVLRESTYKF